MRCECCDRELNDSEISAKFVERDGSKPHRFVGMCRECRSFLPPDVRYVFRPEKSQREEDTYSDPFDIGEYGDDESW